MGAGPSAADGDRNGGSNFTAGQESLAQKVRVTLEDLELPARRDVPTASAALGQLLGGGEGGAGGGEAPGGAGVGVVAGPGAAGAAAAAVGQPRILEELLPGGEAVGQKAFEEDGLVGTEAQQLQLLAHYAELCDDFRLYQRTTRQEGAPSNSDGAQLLLLSGPPGTGKTKHAVSFARALGLPLLMASPPTSTSGGSSSSGSAVPRSSSGWAAQLRREVKGKDCAVFFDEIDQHAADEGFSSGLRQFLDGVCQPSGSRVLLVGTTNRIDRLPEDVRHRAEVVTFDRPAAEHLSEMWQGFAKHLKEPELAELAAVSAKAKATGRDVRHCASLCERETAIKFLNEQRGMGYCHGAALANCPGPSLDRYLQCVRGRSLNVE
eukprot:TRINITY_DN24962_c0_g1_i2.p1 TRINITY_DN24962_c0_g1~~TRINITY_DN24962_c0_g1_i2.p1  ORF type:complete len:378 (-),score=84.13 TRINITY_DN24962_c0_g1_i2:47-1180(-)